MDLTLLGQQRVGKVLRGKWHLDRLIDVGGMAAVYEATHRNGTRAAIKMLHPKYVSDVQARTRFLREGYAANRVGHLGAVSVLDDDFTEEGDVYLVMELLDGESLEAALMRETTLSAVDVLSIADQLLDVLTCAHAKEIIHRDIKPANIMLTRQGIVKLLDFGLARVKELPAVAGVHSTEIVFGTVAYVSPEAARANNEAMDGRADLWAVAATMFKALTGETVHGMDGSVVERLIRAAKNQARSINSLAPHLPPRVCEVIDRALMFERDDRWPSAMVMQAIVQDVLQELMEETGAPPSLFFRPGLGQQPAMPSFTPITQNSVTASRSPTPRPTPYQQAAAVTPSPSPYPYPRPAQARSVTPPPHDPWGHNPLNALPPGAQGPWAAPSNNPLNQVQSNNPLNQVPGQRGPGRAQTGAYNPLNYPGQQDPPTPSPEQFARAQVGYPGARPVTPATTQKINIHALNLDGRPMGAPPRAQTPIPAPISAPVQIDVEEEDDDETGASPLELTITIEDDHDEEEEIEIQRPASASSVDRRTTVRNVDLLRARQSLDERLKQPVAPPASSGSGFEIEVDESNARSSSSASMRIELDEADMSAVSGPGPATTSSPSMSFMQIDVEETVDPAMDSALSRAEEAGDEATLDFSRSTALSRGSLTGVVSGTIGDTGPSTPRERPQPAQTTEDTVRRPPPTAADLLRGSEPDDDVPTIERSEDTVRRAAPTPTPTPTEEVTVRRFAPTADEEAPEPAAPPVSEDTVRRFAPTSDEASRRPVPTASSERSSSGEDTVRVMSPFVGREEGPRASAPATPRVTAPSLPTLPTLPPRGSSSSGATPPTRPTTMPVIPSLRGSSSRSKIGAPPIATPPIATPPIATPPTVIPPVAAPTITAPVAAPTITPPVAASKAPRVQAPVVQAPVVQAPVVQAPSVQAPVVQAPVAPTAKVQAPTLTPPASTPAPTVPSAPVARPAATSRSTSTTSSPGISSRPIAARGASSRSAAPTSSDAPTPAPAPEPPSSTPTETPTTRSGAGVPSLPPRGRRDAARPAAERRGTPVPAPAPAPTPRASEPTASPSAKPAPASAAARSTASEAPSRSTSAPSPAPARGGRTEDPYAHLRGSSNPDRTVRVAIPTPASLPELAQRRPEPPAEASPEVTESMITRIEPTSGPKAPPKPPESALEVTESMITRLPDLPDLPASPKPRKTSLGPLPKLPPRKS